VVICNDNTHADSLSDTAAENVEVGNVKALASCLPVSAAPTFSADGKLVHVSGRGEYGMLCSLFVDLHGEIVHELDVWLGDVKWTRDGGKVASTNENEGKLYVLGTSKGGLPEMPGQELVPSEHKAKHVKWSPDGRNLIFESRKDLSEKTFGAHIWTIGVDGKELRQITDAPDWGSPVFGPDGAVIYAIGGLRSEKPAGIYAIKRDGANARLIREFTPMDLAYVSTSDMALSPDGSKVVVLGGVRSAALRNKEFRFDLWVIDTNGKSWKRLSLDEYTPVGCDWSPDGTHLVFRSLARNQAVLVTLRPVAR